MCCCGDVGGSAVSYCAVGVFEPGSFVNLAVVKVFDTQLTESWTYDLSADVGGVDSQVTGIDMDDQGNVYVTWWYSGGSGSYTSVFRVTKFNNLGALQWSTEIGEGRSTAFQSPGNFYGSTHFKNGKVYTNHFGILHSGGLGDDWGTALNSTTGAVTFVYGPTSTTPSVLTASGNSAGMISSFAPDSDGNVWMSAGQANGSEPSDNIRARAFDGSGNAVWEDDATPANRTINIYEHFFIEGDTLYAATPNSGVSTTSLVYKKWDISAVAGGGNPISTGSQSHSSNTWNHSRDLDVYSGRVGVAQERFASGPTIEARFFVDGTTNNWDSGGGDDTIRSVVIERQPVLGYFAGYANNILGYWDSDGGGVGGSPTRSVSVGGDVTALATNAVAP